MQRIILLTLSHCNSKELKSCFLGFVWIFGFLELLVLLFPVLGAAKVYLFVLLLLLVLLSFGFGHFSGDFGEIILIAQIHWFLLIYE